MMMMRLTTFLAAATATTTQIVTAVNLFVSSYDGNVTTLSLEGSGRNHTLKATSQSHDCGPQPSWMVFDKLNSILYCMDENFAASAADPSAVFISYTVDQTNGALTVANSGNLTTASSVSGVLFGDNKFMAVAGYSGQVSALTIDKTTFKQAQVLDFVNKTELGPGQLLPHPHQAILDPTGKYVIVPDLGGDLLRVFSWNATTTNNNILVEQTPFKVKSGSGPRHVAFWKGDAGNDSLDDTYLFVLAELANTVTTYNVSYSQEGALGFTEFNTQDTFGGAAFNPGARAAEIQVSPDARFLVVSNRNDSSYEIDKYGSTSTNEKEKSDSLATYAIGQGGRLTFKQIWPAGGLFPRHFAMNKAGDKVAVGLQSSCRIVILCRDVESGLLGRPVAHLLLGNCDPAAGKPATPTMIVWDE